MARITLRQRLGRSPLRQRAACEARAANPIIEPDSGGCHEWLALTDPEGAIRGDHTASDPEPMIGVVRNVLDLAVGGA